MGWGKVLLLLQLSLLFVGSFTAEVDGLNSALPPHAPAHPPHHHHRHHHPPAEAPSHHHHRHPPAEAPSHHHGHHGHPPAHPPAHPPSHGLHPPPKPLPPKPAPPVHPPKPAPPVHPVPPVHPPKPHPPKPTPPVHPPKPAPGPYHPPIRPHPFPRAFVAVQGVVYCKSCKYPGVETLTGASPVLGATVKLQCNNTKYPLVVTAKTDKNGYFFLEAPKTITNYGVHKCKVFLGQSPLPKCSKPSPLHGGVSGAELKPEKRYYDKNKLPFVLFTVGPLAYEPQCQ